MESAEDEPDIPRGMLVGAPALFDTACAGEFAGSLRGITRTEMSISLDRLFDLLGSRLRHVS